MSPVWMAALARLNQPDPYIAAVLPYQCWAMHGGKRICMGWAKAGTSYCNYHKERR